MEFGDEIENEKVIKSIAKTCANIVNLQEKMTDEAAKVTLQEFSPKPTGVCKSANEVSVQYDLQIIVPAYNVIKYIRDCLNSVLYQKTTYNILVTIINDGSTDDTGLIISEILNVYVGAKVELIEQSNKGFSGARNAALKNIKAKYVTFVDSDDILTDGAIQKCLI